MKFDKEKKGSRLNVKVIVTSLVAITLIGIVGISIGRGYSGSNSVSGLIMDTSTFLQENINKGFKFLKENFSDIIKFKENAEKVDDLKNENDKLKNEVVALKNQLSEMESLKDLKKSLNFVDEKYSANMISSSVVGKNDGNWYTTFVIGVGKDDGVKKDSVVVNGDGLVGIVYEVSKNYSKAISILDTKSSVSFKVPGKPEFKGIITQNVNIKDMEDYKEKGYLYGYMFDTSYEVLPGDIITTSGLGLYPEGIIIGEVDQVIEDKNQSMKYVIVKPSVNFKNIDDVAVIEPRKIDGE